MGPDYGRRLEKLRDSFTGKGLDGVFISSLRDIYYYTGKEISKPDPGFLLVTGKKSTLFVSTLNNMLEGPGVRILTDFRELKKELKSAGKLGFDEGNLTVMLHRRFGSPSWKPFSESLKAIRAVKDRYEILQMRNAVSATLRIFGSLVLKGKQERGVVAEIHHKTRLGGNVPAFEPIVASGRNSAFIHYRPGKPKITRGLVIVDMGVRCNGYCSDLTRTFAISPGPKEKSMLERCQEIQSELIDMAVPGTRFGDIEKRYEESMKSSGFPLLHGFGHGIGLSVHERPSGNDTLEKGMVLTVEPGIYRKGMGGCRIEDMVLVGDKPSVISR
jgi:Xaa-Pro aminopeptidase